jgi:hypothetical protein
MGDERGKKLVAISEVNRLASDMNGWIDGWMGGLVE